MAAPKSVDHLSRIAQNVLGLPSPVGWEIIDSKGDLVMVHCKRDYENIYPNLRGVVVDVKKQCLVAPSIGCTPVLNMNSVTVDQEGQLTLIHPGNDGDVKKQYPAGSFVFQHAPEGVVVRVLRYQGQVYYMSYRKLDCSRSRWGSGPSFKEMYQQAGGPSEETLFPHDREACYNFMVVHPNLLVGSKQMVGENGYLYYLGCSGDSVSLECTGEPLSAVVGKPCLFPTSHLSVEEVNHLLRSGFHNISYGPEVDTRLYTSEPVMVYITENGKTVAYKICPDGYNWRLSMRANKGIADPNVLHCFYDLLDHVQGPILSDADIRTFAETFPLLPELSDKDIDGYWKVDHVDPILEIPVGIRDFESGEGYLRSPQGRLRVIWLAFLFSLPYCHQRQGLFLLENFLHDRNQAIRDLQRLEGSLPESYAAVKDKEFPKRIFDIIDVARKRGSKKYHEALEKEKAKPKKYIPPRARGKQGKDKDAAKPLNFYIDEAIRNIVLKEFGSSLYRIVHWLHDQADERAKQAEEKTQD